MNERELTTKALNQLEFHTGLVANVTPVTPSPGQNDQANALIEFNKCNAKLVAQLKRWGVDRDIDKVIEQITAAAGSKNKILISDYINDEAGLRLREAKVNYLDKAGNAYLDVAPIYVFIQGKVPKELPILDKTARLFTETGLKVIFALLAKSSLLNASYREIADQANVSMGTIGWVLRELKDQRYSVEMSRKREWKNKARLIKKWTEEYPNLREKNQLGVYYVKHRDWWQSVDLEKYDAVFGGEIAALSYLDNVTPRNGIIYVGKHKQGGLIRDLGLREASASNNDDMVTLEIRSKFWGHTEQSGLLHNSTHPLITYADLMDTWDAKSRQLAHRLADAYL